MGEVHIVGKLKYMQRAAINIKIMIAVRAEKMLILNINRLRIAE